MENGNISDDFVTEDKKIRPVIWSHDNMADSTSSTGMCMNLASHGYIVFAITHFDGSSGYTE